MWWIAIWVLLLAGSLAVTAWLCWRIFLASKQALHSLGDVTSQIGKAQAGATQLHARWIELRAEQDDDYRAILAERARPVPASLALPQTMLDKSVSFRPPR